MLRYFSIKFLVNSYRAQQTRHAIKTGIAAVVTILIYQYLHLPQGYWAVITAVIIMQSNIESGSLEITLQLAIQRFVGTLSGALSGFIVLLLLQPNYWQLLIIIFLLIVIGSILVRLYQGFNLFGPTALIIILLSYQQPLTQNIAMTRSIEILLGLIIAIAVTIFVWPYRITQHLNENRKKRFHLIYQQFLSLLNVCKGQDFSASWKIQQQKLSTINRNEQKYVNAALGDLREKNQAELDLEMTLIKYITRLGETLPQLPASFWEFANIRANMISLMETLTKELKYLPMQDSTDDSTTLIKEKIAILLSTFTKFRLFRLFVFKRR